MKLKFGVVALLAIFILVGTAMAQAPKTIPGNIYDTLAANPDYSTLVALIDKSNGVKQLLTTQPGPFTMFAPTNEAFAKLSPETMNKVKGNPTVLDAVLYNYVIPGKYMAKDLVTLKECKTLCPTAQAMTLHFTETGGKYLVQNAQLVKTDMAASNGMIQGIDTAYLPTFAPPVGPLQ